MNAVEGIWKNGQVLLQGSADWPEGTSLLVEPIVKEQIVGIREEDWPETPEATEEWLRWYQSLEPLDFTPEEEAEWAAWRKKTKEYTIANMHKGLMGCFHETIPPRHWHH
jgi:hypothetical protein